MTDTIRLAHGFGGRLTQELLDEVIAPAISGVEGHEVTLDAAVIADLEPPIVVSTDSFTVIPRFFPGGDIGKLAICGTINDVAMMGARPRYFSLALIIEEGFAIDELRRIMASIGETARKTGVRIITGDTKVVEKGSAGGIFINTTGFGTRVFGPVGPDRIRPGDAIIVSGDIADHGAAILNARENLGFSGALESDCAPLWDLVESVSKAVGSDLHALRDPTRGGVAATLNEFARDTGLQFIIEEAGLPVRPEVSMFLGVLGMDPLPIANEGKCLLFVSAGAAKDTLDALHNHPQGRRAALIGRVEKGARAGRVILETRIGSRRIVEMPLEDGLPRIC